jgi:signal transduction histidine kinase
MAQPASTSKDVLVLHGGNLSLPASSVLDPVMRDALDEHTRASVSIETESLEAISNMRVRDPIAEARRLTAKYAGRHFDLIIPVTGPALVFVLAQRRDLWPEVPVFFYAVGDDLLADLPLPAGVAGATLHAGVGETLALATSLQPGARELVVVSGVTEYDRRWFRLFSKLLKPFPPGRQRVTELVGLSVTDLQHRLAGVSPDAMVLFLSVGRDEAGQDYRSRDVVRRISRTSRAPVYGVLGSYIGYGIVGGVVQDLPAHGRQAGMIAAQLLNGERSIDSVGVVASPSVCQIDARELDRWRLSRANLPAGCVILFPPEASWPFRRSLVLAIGGAGVMVALVFALQRQRRLRSRAEGEARRGQKELAHAARLKSVGEISASIVHEITQPLSAILSNTAVAERLLQRGEFSVEELGELVADIRRDDLRANEIVRNLGALLRKHELRLLPTDVNALVSSTVRLVGPEATKRGLVVHTELKVGLPMAAGDAVHLQQVLMNLIVNALDAMEASPRASAIDVRTRQEGAAFVCVEVTDQGHGIPKEVLPRLFDSFFTTKHDGMGLGLSIARTIVEAHGGRIWAENSSGGGAVFRFTVPLSSAPDVGG